MSICVYDGGIVKKNVLSSNVLISINNTNIHFDSVIPNSTTINDSAGSFVFQNNGFLTFKSVLGSNIIVASDNTNILINSGVAQDAINVGTQSNIVFNGVQAGQLTFNSIMRGTNIALVPTDTTIQINNTAPNQVVNIVGGSGILVGGGYPNYTITNDTAIIIVNKVFGRIYASPNNIVNATTTTTNLIVNTFPTTALMVGFNQFSNALLTCTDSTPRLYHIMGYFIFERGPQGYYGYLAKNGGLITNSIIAEPGNQDSNKINLTGVATLVNGDYVSIQFARASGSASVTIYSMGIITKSF